MSRQVILIIILILLIEVAAMLLYKNLVMEQAIKTVENTSITLLPGGVDFVGQVTAIDDACNRDGICRIAVNNVWIITELGGDVLPEASKARGARGRIIDSKGVVVGALAKDMVGKTVWVYVTPITEDGKPITTNLKVVRDGVTAAKTYPDGFSLYGNPNFYISFLPIRN